MTDSTSVSLVYVLPVYQYNSRGIFSCHCNTVSNNINNCPNSCVGRDSVSLPYCSCGQVQQYYSGVLSYLHVACSLSPALYSPINFNYFRSFRCLIINPQQCRIYVPLFGICYVRYGSVVVVLYCCCGIVEILRRLP